MISASLILVMIFATAGVFLCLTILRFRGYSFEHRFCDDSSGVPICDICNSEMFGLHCKLICNNCGYIRDCSDP